MLLFAKKALDQIKEITVIEKFNRNKMLIHTDYKLTDDITLTNLVKLITSVTKADGQFNPQIFLKEALSIK